MTKFMSTCPSCGQQKSSHILLASLLQPFPVAQCPFQPDSPLHRVISPVTVMDYPSKMVKYRDLPKTPSVKATAELLLGIQHPLFQSLEKEDVVSYAAAMGQRCRGIWDGAMGALFYSSSASVLHHIYMYMMVIT